MKNSIRYKINRLIAMAVIVITVILLGISLLVANRFSGSVSSAIIMDSATAKSLKLNSQQRSVEQAVLSIYEVSKYALDDYPELNTPEEIEDYLNVFKGTAISIAGHTDGGVAVYFRLSPEVAGNGKAGFFYVRENRYGAFAPSEITDILAYEKDDEEHVGWYYRPLKIAHGVWLSPYYNANVGFDMISYVIPVYRNGVPFGVVGMDVDFDVMLKAAEDVDGYDSSGANLIDLQSRRVYYNKCNLLGESLSDELYSLLREGTKSAELLPFRIGNEKYSMHFVTVHNGMKLIVYAKNSDIYSLGKTIIISGSIIFAAVFFLTLFVAVRLSGKIVGPITQINNATKEYAKGNWDAKLYCETDDELKELTDNILEMAQTTKKNIDNLRDALAVAQSASKAKSTFLSNVSHDIRTPMNAIISYSQFAISQPDLTEKTRSYLEQILKASNHLLSLINSVLDMSRIESGKIEINLVPCNIRELMEELENLVFANVREKKQILEIDVSDVRHENILCDSLRFNQVMINLVGNAVKFTGDGGKISVVAREEKSQNPDEYKYHISIKDTGIGIDESFIDNIFTPFEREGVSVDGIQGTGLGLAITKNLVEMMGGSIGVKSKKGQGTEFYIDISFKAAKEEALESSLTGMEDEDVDIDSLDFTGLKILLADDNKVNRLIVKELLKGRVQLIDEAANGQEAVEAFTTKEPGYYSLILMDVQMPTMDGYEATRAIRSLEERDDVSIPIIAMTANAFEEDRRNAFNAGMNAHVAKPIDVTTLFKTIYRLVIDL